MGMRVWTASAESLRDRARRRSVVEAAGRDPLRQRAIQYNTMQNL